MNNNIINNYIKNINKRTIKLCKNNCINEASQSPLLMLSTIDKRIHNPIVITMDNTRPDCFNNTNLIIIMKNYNQLILIT